MSDLLDEYRAQAPDDFRSDAELTLIFAGRPDRDDLLKNYPEFAKQYDELRAEIDEISKPTAGDYAKQALGSAVRGFGRSISDIPKSAALLGRKVQEVLGPIAAAIPPTAPGSELMTKAFELEAEKVDALTEAVAPEPVGGLEKSFWASSIPAGFGSTASFFAGGLAGKALKIPHLLSVGGISAAGGVQGYEEAKAEGASEDKAFASFLLNAGVNLSEIVPVVGMLNRINRFSGGTFKRALMTAGKESLEESIQEVFQSGAGDIIAKNIVAYDPDRVLFSEAMENAKVGGVVGFTLSLLASAVGAKMSKGRRQEPTEEIPPEVANYIGKLTPQDRAEFAELGAKEEAEQLSQQEKQTVEGFRGTRRAAYQFVKSQPITLGADLEEEIAQAYARVVAERSPEALAAEEEESRLGREAAFQEAMAARMDEETRSAAELEGGPAAVSAPGDVVEAAPVPMAEGAEGVGEQVGEGVSGTELGAAVPPAAAVAPVVLDEERLTPSPPKTPELVALDSLLELESPDELLDKLAFETGTVAATEAGRGKQAAPAFVETEDEAELAKDSIADASDKTKSRKMAAMLTPDGRVLMGKFTINGTGPRAKRVSAVSRDGKLENVALVELKGRGYRLLGALKTKEPMSGHYAVTYTPEQWARFAGQAQERLRAQRSSTIGSVPAVGFEEGGEVSRVVPVEERTAADALSDAEGFTEDEAGALFDALAGVKPEQVSTVLPGLVRKNADVRNAMAKLFLAFENRGDDAEVLQEVLSYVNDAKRLQGRSKEGFAKSLVAAVTGAAGKGDGGRGAEASAQAGEVVSGVAGQGEGVQAGSSASPARTDVGATGSGGAAAAAAGAGEDAVRFHGGPVSGQLSVVSSSEDGARWQGTLRGAAMNGVNVNVLDAEAVGMAREIGHVDTSTRVVTLFLGDLHQPGAEGQFLLNEEVGHIVFAGLPKSQQAMLLEAVRRAFREGGPVDGESFRIAKGVKDPEAVLQEERLMERMALRMTEQGFNPDQSRGFAQAFWRLLKSLYLRAAMAWNRAWGLSAERGAELAAEYFQTRVEGWLAGDKRALSFVDFMGGVFRVEHVAQWHTPAYGATALSYRWNADTFSMEVQEMSPDNVRAIEFNAANPTIRYHTPRGVLSPREVSPETGPEVKAEDIAANNEVEWALGGQFQRWVANGNNITTTGQPGLTSEGFQRWVLPPLTDLPAENVAKCNAELARAGKAELPTTLAISDLNDETKRYAGTKAHAFLQKIRAFWENRKNEADETLNPDKPGSTQRKYDRAARRSMDLSKRYLDGEFLFEEMRQDVVGWAKFLRDNARRIGTLGHQEGELEQVLRELEGKMDEGVATRYADVIDRLVKRFADSEHTRVSFVEMLENIAATEIPWSEMSVAEIKDVIRNSTYPELASSQLDRLRENTPEGRGLLAIAAVFAKRNDLVMAMLSLRHAKTQYEDRAAVERALELAMSDQREAFKNARATLDKQNRLQVKAERILVELERVKEDQGKLKEELLEAGRFTDFFADAMPLLREQMARTEKLLGGSEVVFEATYGEKYVVPPNANAAVADVEKNERVYQHERDGGADRQLKEDLRMMQAWLDAHGRGNPLHGGATYNRLSIQIDKLIENEMQGQQDKGRRDMVQAILGSMAAKLDQSANPSAKAISRRLRQYMTHLHSYKAPVESWAIDFSNAENKARKALGYKREQLDAFRSRWGGPARSYMEGRTDLLAGAPNIDVAEERAIAAAADYMKVPGPARKAFAEYHKTWSRVSYNLVEASRKMGNKVEDDANGLFRDVRGARGFESMQIVSHRLHLLFGEMMGQPNAPGPWVVARIKASEAEAEYASDPDALRTRLAPLFTKKVWLDFVKPLVDRPATFEAPKDTGGFYQLARVEDVKLAFKQTAAGDVVGFAENLYAITGGTTDMGEFVAETLDTFEKYFKLVNRVHQEQSMASKYSIEPVQQLLMNARQSESFPQEWKQYQVFDLHRTRSAMNHLAFHAAFGRGMVGIEKDFDTAIEYFGMQQEKLRRLIEEQGTGSRAKLKEAAKKEGLHLETLEAASKQAAMLEYELKSFRNFVNTSGGVPMEFRAWAELMSTAVSMVVQGPGTALIDTISLFKPIQEVGLNRIGLEWTARNIKSFVTQNVGSLLEVVGKTIKSEADYIARLHQFGHYDTTLQHSLRERVASVLMNQPLQPAASMMQRVGRALAAGSRIGREALRTGVGVSRPTDPQFFRFKPLAIFTQTSQTMAAGSTIATWKTFEDMVGRAAQWLNNPARAKELNDAAFTFTREHAKHLGYRKGLLGLLDNEAGFETMLAKLNQYGMTLERLAKDYVARGTTGPVLSDKAYGRLLPLASAELMQEGSILTRPSMLLTNPALHTALPLVGWAISQTASVGQSFYPKLSDPDMRSFRKGLVSFTALMGIGLAYSFLRDWYDEDVLKKKSNRLSLTGDNLALAMIDRMDQVGSIGILGSLVNSTFNVATAREFTIDSRVFAVSSFSQLYRVAGTWMRQGTATYATVGRPLLQAMGGSGYLQYVQALNTLTGGIPGFENEARVTARINANNWLRVAGRELGLDVRISRGGAGELPGPMRPWIVEMTMAAYANDPVEFEQAYRKAVAVARELGRPDPEESVARSFQYHHPLRTVFRSPPTERDYERLLRALPSDGRRDVMEAVRLVDAYSQRLGLKAYAGKRPARAAASRPGLNLNLPRYGLQDYRDRSLRLMGAF